MALERTTVEVFPGQLLEYPRAPLHENSPDIRYWCPVCWFPYTKRFGLQRHLANCITRYHEGRAEAEHMRHVRYLYEHLPALPGPAPPPPEPMGDILPGAPSAHVSLTLPVLTHSQTRRCPWAMTTSGLTSH